MESQLQELIDKIKSEGVKSAEEQAKQITEEAEKQAEQIKADAQKKADKIVADAKQEAEKLQQSGEEALTQAGRDLLLTLEKKITVLFDSVVKQEVDKSLSDNVVAESVSMILKNWSKEHTGNLSVLISEEQFDKLEKKLKTALAEEMKKGVEVKPFRRVKSGFYIAEKDGSAYYNFSGDGLAENLSELLNPRLKEIMEKALS